MVYLLRHYLTRTKARAGSSGARQPTAEASTATSPSATWSRTRGSPQPGPRSQHSRRRLLPCFNAVARRETSPLFLKCLVSYLTLLRHLTPPERITRRERNAVKKKARGPFIDSAERTKKENALVSLSSNIILKKEQVLSLLISKYDYIITNPNQPPSHNKTNNKIEKIKTRENMSSSV